MLAVYGFDDLELARKLQEEYDREAANDLVSTDMTWSSGAYGDNATTKAGIPFTPSLSPVDPSLEISDPNPDIRELFLQFNDQFFWSRLAGIEVKWSPRMTLCAGLCVYEGHGGLCSVRLSQPLLKLRPRKDLVETLLHEMIHAFLFVTDNDRDHDGHGPNFHKHMYRINKETGAKISVYHTFHDEVASYQQHWWKCDGPCKSRPPYYGMVKRAMNRAPSQRDPWFHQHQATCGGTFVKVREPEGYGQKKSKNSAKHVDKSSSNIKSFVGNGNVLSGSSTGNPGGTSSKGTKKSDDSSSGNQALAYITNGVLERKKPAMYSGDISRKENSKGIHTINGKMNKGPSQLFSSFQSTSNSSSSSSKSSSTSSLTSASSSTSDKKSNLFSQSTGFKNQSQVSKTPVSAVRNNTRPTLGGKSHSGKSKKNFNDNITLLELFKRKQARDKAKKDGEVLAGSNPIDGGFIADSDDDVDDFVDLAAEEDRKSEAKHPQITEEDKQPEVMIPRITSIVDDKHPEAMIPRITSIVDDITDHVIYDNKKDNEDSKTKSKSVSTPEKHPTPRPRWKSIFPGLSGKKNKDRLKGRGKGREGIFSKDFVSVCESGDLQGVKNRRKSGSNNVRGKSSVEKRRKKKVKYVFDDLDNNEGLWEDGKERHGDSASEVSKSEGTKSSNVHYVSGVSSAPSSSHTIPPSAIAGCSRVSGLDADKVNAPAGTSSVNSCTTGNRGGYLLGSGDTTNLTYLAQMRQALKGEDRSHTSNDRGNPSNKRSSGVAFGDAQYSTLPSPKRHSVETGNEDMYLPDVTGLNADLNYGLSTENVNDRSSIAERASDTVECPVCMSRVSQSNINEHLDRCLS